MSKTINSITLAGYIPNGLGQWGTKKPAIDIGWASGIFQANTEMLTYHMWT